MYQNLSPYNIPDQNPIYAGSYLEMDFRLYSEIEDQYIDLTRVPNIGFAMCLYGNYDDSALEFTLKDNNNVKPRIIIDPNDVSHLTIYIYADDTEFFEDSYYDYQITFIGHEKKDSAVVGQGKIKVFNKINNKY